MTREGATIYDVARAAGVSPSTVSRTFSRPGRVSADTARRIRQVARELGYQTKSGAQPPAPTATRVIGLLVTDVTNPAGFRIVRGAQTAAAEAGYIVTILDTRESAALERDVLERCLPLIDALIMVGPRLPDADLRTVAGTLPLVLLNRRVPGLPCLVPDLAAGARASVRHLRDLRHRSVTYLAGPEASWDDGLRWRALRDTASQLGLTAQRLGPLPPTLRGGRGAAAELVARGEKAVICSNDMMAIGLMVGLNDLRVSVPGQVSVIGHDSIFAGTLISPPLTTVGAPLTQMGAIAVQHLVAKLTGDAADDATVPSLPVQLMVRGSTGPA